NDEGHFFAVHQDGGDIIVGLFQEEEGTCALAVVVVGSGGGMRAMQAVADHFIGNWVAVGIFREYRNAVAFMIIHQGLTSGYGVLAAQEGLFKRPGKQGLNGSGLSQGNGKLKGFLRSAGDAWVGA